MIRCKLCHDTGRVNEARQSKPCSCQTPQWIYEAAQEAYRLVCSGSATPEVIANLIDAHRRAAIEEQAKDCPF